MKNFISTIDNKLHRISRSHALLWEKFEIFSSQIIFFSFNSIPSTHRTLYYFYFPFAVFVSSKSCIYITPPNSESKITIGTSELPSSSSFGEPIYENIENYDGNSSDVAVQASVDSNNKFTIYVNYDFIKGEKSSKSDRNKSSVRLLEPDVKLVQMNEDDNYFRDDCSDDEENANDKGISKMIQCQQISMYIGEKNGSTQMFSALSFITVLNSLNSHSIFCAFVEKCIFRPRGGTLGYIFNSWINFLNLGFIF